MLNWSYLKVRRSFHLSHNLLEMKSEHKYIYLCNGESSESLDELKTYIVYLVFKHSLHHA